MKNEQIQTMLQGWGKENDIIKNFVKGKGLLQEVEKVLAANSINTELRENSIGPESLSN